MHLDILGVRESVDRFDRPESTDSARIVGKRCGDTVIAFPYAASAARDQAFASVLARGWIGGQCFGDEVLQPALESWGIGGFGGAACSSGPGHVRDPLEDEQAPAPGRIPRRRTGVR